VALGPAETVGGPPVLQFLRHTTYGGLRLPPSASSLEAPCRFARLVLTLPEVSSQPQPSVAPAVARRVPFGHLSLLRWPPPSNSNSNVMVLRTSRCQGLCRPTPNPVEPITAVEEHPSYRQDNLRPPFRDSELFSFNWTDLTGQSCTLEGV
jgi:hypothetical protein